MELKFSLVVCFQPNLASILRISSTLLASTSVSRSCSFFCQCNQFLSYNLCSLPGNLNSFNEEGGHYITDSNSNLKALFAAIEKHAMVTKKEMLPLELPVMVGLDFGK